MVIYSTSTVGIGSDLAGRHIEVIGGSLCLCLSERLTSMHMALLGHCSSDSQLTSFNTRRTYVLPLSQTPVSICRNHKSADCNLKKQQCDKGVKKNQTFEYTLTQYLLKCT